MAYRKSLNTYEKMNSKNLELHAIKKAKAMINSQTYNKNIVDIIICSDNNTLRCCVCPQDDIEYCGLRTSNISNEDMWIQYCTAAFLKLKGCETI